MARDYSELTKAEKDARRGSRGGVWRGIQRSGLGPYRPEKSTRTAQRSLCRYCGHYDSRCRCNCCGGLLDAMILPCGCSVRQHLRLARRACAERRPS